MAVHPIKLGKNTRMSYSRIGEVLDMPNLIEIQKNSYDWFLTKGLAEVFHDISQVTDFSGNLILEFVDYSIDGTQNIPWRSAKNAQPFRPLCVRRFIL